ncbi:hypothetical protein [uncultured Clostridium sp.]|uniref:hypothetical protein n=1 Tax=uncultured Clostridium sp. TaxID=59620 RepID=UPI0025E1E4C4|nr:hypothetical protein [uncultured Clostridium sp.]
MLTVLNFIAEHYDEMLAIIGGIVSIATIIVKISPSKRDDEILAKIVNVLAKLSLINTKQDAKILEAAKKDK